MIKFYLLFSIYSQFKKCYGFEFRLQNSPLFRHSIFFLIIQDFPTNDEQFGKPSKEEYVIAKWLKQNVHHKKTKFLYHYVEYFTGAKAVDALMESQFAQGDEPLFTSRTSVVHFLDE